MFRWWFRLNLRLAFINQSRLTERQLTASVNSLYRFPPWSTPPAPMLDYGRQCGFVAPAWSPGSYVFPLAHLTAFTSPSVRSGMASILEDWSFQGARNEAMRLQVTEAVESVLASFGEKISHIVKAREGLPPSEKATLEELGTFYGLSRERIRQIESKFWRKVRYPQIWRNSAITSALLAEIMWRQGNLVLDSNAEDTPHLRFAAKCLGIPSFQTGFGSFVVFGVNTLDLPLLSPVVGSGFVERAAKHLDSGDLSFMDRESILQMAEAIAAERMSHLTKQEKVYLALRHIGKNAHYSEVAAIYDQLFTGDRMTEHNVHAILSRCAAPEVEQYGIVWVGAKGIYGLKEHGYERPPMRLFDAVSKIVKEKYNNSQRPIHITAIASELPKHHPTVSSSSLVFATSMNPGIRQVTKDYFVPKDASEGDGGEDAARRLDKALREFRADHSPGS